MEEVELRKAKWVLGDRFKKAGLTETRIGGRGGRSQGTMAKAKGKTSIHIAVGLGDARVVELISERRREC